MENHKVRCEICKREFKNVIAISTHIHQTHKIKSKDYYDHYVKTNSNDGICKMYTKVSSCKKHTRFISCITGYSDFCSARCSTLSEDTQKKKEETCLEKYKTKHPMKNKVVITKFKTTCLEKWGVDNPQKVKEINQKTIKTQELKYGGCGLASLELVKKTENTNLKKYGKKNYFSTEEFKIKREETCLKIYKTKHPMQTDEVQENYKQTILENNKINPNRINEIKEKQRQTCLKNLGVENPMYSDKIKEKVIKKKKDKFIKELGKYLEYLKIELLDKEYINAGFKHNWKCLKCNTKFKQIWNEIQQGYLCPKCYPRNDGTSLAEKEVYKFICELIGKDKVEHNCRNLIKNPKTNYFLEIDIYIPFM